MPTSAPVIEPLYQDDILIDIRVTTCGKTRHMWGRKGPERERNLAEMREPSTLPVLIGAGLGVALEQLASSGPVAVIDRHDAISKAVGSKRFRAHPNILWLDTDSERSLEILRQWQQDNGGMPFSVLPIPFYLNLDREHYKALAETLKVARPSFFEQARYPKFQSAKPRILLFDTNYFLYGEIKTALQRLGIPYLSTHVAKQGKGSSLFVEELLNTILTFKPDFALTVNHFGLDRDGRLLGLLENLQLPIASWFVDNPHLILHRYPNQVARNLSLFTFDAANVDSLTAMGFHDVR